MTTFCLSQIALVLCQVMPLAADGAPVDLRNIRTGSEIPDEGYCDQPYVAITKDGNWLCTLTTGAGKEGDRGQHIISTISTDRGKTWSGPVDIEPASGPEASWVIPLVTPAGRVYVFYTYNGDKVQTLGEKSIRADTLGWYAYKYSDDHGRSWSGERYRIPLPKTEFDFGNEWGGENQLFWGIGKPLVEGQTAYFAFSKIGNLAFETTEGRVFRSDNVLSEPDPAKVEWKMFPRGDPGISSRDLGPVQEEHNIVTLSDGSLYCMYRTIEGYPARTCSRDRGETWTKPEPPVYAHGGHRMKNPRACPRIWKTSNGKYLFWFHNNGLKSWDGRNPAWVSGGVERDGDILWSQPEIVLYDSDPKTKISYPDLVEENGRYWITETQKSVARVHEIDPSLFEGLWTQGQVKEVARDGLVLDVAGPGNEADLPTLPRLADGGGLTIDCWVAFDDLAPGQVVFDSRDDKGKGIVLETIADGAVRITLNDGQTGFSWDSDAGVFESGKRHHIAVIVDGGPKAVSFVVDGVLCDGGTDREYGWGRFPAELGDVNGAGQVRIAPSASRVRVYNRYLRTSEVLGNFHAKESSGMNPWTFVFVADIQVGSPKSFRFAPAWKDNWDTARKQILDVDPELMLVGGDLTRDGYVAEHQYELEEIKADLDALPFPYHVTPGNMDAGNKPTKVRGARKKRDDVSLSMTSDQLGRFREVFGPDRWTFVHKNVRFSSFCTMLLGSGLPEEEALWQWLDAQKSEPRAQYHVWMTHYAIFVDEPGEPNFDITDPDQYHDWYFGVDEPHRSRLIDVFHATGTTLVLSGHIHCRKLHEADGIQYQIGPATCFPQWANRWPDGDATLGFLRYDVTEEGLTPTFIPLDKLSNRKGYGPGGHPLPEDRDYSIAWEK